ncbi:MAG: hypothetical protein H6592_00425 [Flavobacteriales bacterium]|nr:hypothetical protein [Flavobacteriales bacterium]
MARQIPLLLLFLCSSLLMGQVVTDRSVILTGAFPEDRQVTGLPDSEASDAVLTTTTERRGAYRTAAPVAGNVWSIDLGTLTAAPPAGTQLVVVAPAPTSGDIDLLVNGHGPYPLLAAVDVRADGAEIPEGTALSVVMDGSSFQIMNTNVRPRRPCPEGMLTVNARYCIEPVEHPPVDFFAAASTCGSQGMRLCEWGEFITACQRAGEIGLAGTTNSWEWTNDASNENGSARVVGAGSCLSAGNAIVTGSIDRNYRCCYTR